MSSSHPSGSHNYSSGSRQPDDSVQDKPSGKNLAGKVALTLTPEKALPWLVGHGAFTDVWQGRYKAERDSTPTLVAVKIFRMSMQEKPEKIQEVTRRLIRESRVWAKLRHPNIQPYLGYCPDLGLSVALVSPLCNNSSIMKYIHNNPLASKLQLVKEVAIGLEYLHSLNVIHADLHPKNVLVDEQGHARLVDFGRARVIGEAVYRTAFMAGSAPYMAPELLPSADVVDMHDLFSKQSDVYAFAMSCFEIFTDEGPFQGYNVFLDYQVVPLIHRGGRPRCTPHVQSLISQNMWMILETCWAHNPESRLSARQLVQSMP